MRTTPFCKRHTPLLAFAYLCAASHPGAHAHANGVGIVVGVAQNPPVNYVPARISFAELLPSEHGTNAGDENDVFWKALREVGLVSITDVPNLGKQAMMADLGECLATTARGAEGLHTEGFADVGIDGFHRRRTLAMHTLAGSGEGLFAERDPSPACAALAESSRPFREGVEKVLGAIAERFALVPSSLAAAGEGDGAFLSADRLIHEGEHLEHFHSYYPQPQAGKGSGSQTKDKDNANTKTIEWHTDQGMMLVFAPGQRTDGSSTGGFLVRLSDGSTAELDLDPFVDDLVVMLGDGVHQYINQSGNGSIQGLRSVPHAVSLDRNDGAQRLWYGRMVLPPPGAVHPSSAAANTFGELRAATIRGDPSGLGCSSPTAVVSRGLAGDGHEDPGECDEATSMFCWMRCMDYEEYGASPEICGAGNLACANADGEPWAKGVHDPSYKLRCLGSAEADTNATASAGDDGDEPESETMEMDSSGAKDRGTTAFGFLVAVVAATAGGWIAW